MQVSSLSRVSEDYFHIVVLCAIFKIEKEVLNLELISVSISDFGYSTLPSITSWG